MIEAEDFEAVEWIVDDDEEAAGLNPLDEVNELDLDEAHELDVLFKNEAEKMDCHCAGRNRHGDNRGNE